MSVELVQQGGVDSAAVNALIEAKVTDTYIASAACLGYVPVSPALLASSIASLSGLQSQIDAKVDKVGGTLGSAFVKLQNTGGSNVNPYIMWKETVPGSGERDVELAGNRVVLNPSYAVRFTKAVAEFSAGINWDFAGLTTAYTGVGIWSITTSSANVNIVNAGAGRDFVIRNYDDTKKVIVRGQPAMTVPIFEVQRSDGTVVMQVKDIVRPTYNAGDTAAQLGQKLKDLGILT